MISGDKSKEATVTTGNSKINESDHGRLLGVTFDKKLSCVRNMLKCSIKDQPNASGACSFA